jgi:hypothetical protein
MEKALMVQNTTPISGCRNSEINEVLVKIYQVVGILPANFPVDAMILINHLKKYYGSISLAFLFNAFETWARGTQFDVRVEFHGQFSTLFMEGVIQAFQRYVKSKEKQIYEDSVTPTPTPAERYEIMKTGIYHAWREYRTNKRIIDMAGTRWDWLVENKFVNFTDQRMNEFKLRAANDPDSVNIFTLLGSGDKKEVMMEIATKNLVLKAFFDDLIETGTELETILTPNP